MQGKPYARRSSSTLVTSLKRHRTCLPNAITAAILGVVLSAVVPVALAHAGNAEREPRRVVILNSADPYLPAFVALDRAMREAILARHHAPTSFFAEALDMFRFPQAEIDHDEVALLRKKYSGLRIDAIVAAGDASLAFAQLHGGEIWPGVPVVFHSVSEPRLREHRVDGRTLGIPTRLEFATTIDLASRLRPDARRVVVVAGTADLDRRNVDLVKSALQRHAGRLDAEYLVGRTLAETTEAVRALPPDAVVLYLTLFRDGADAPLVPRDALTQLAAASRVPVFGIYETYLGDGIAAGAIASYAQQGRRAGELVARVLNGEDPASIGVQPAVPSKCIADAKQLQRWRIDEDLLPADCEVRFREASLWNDHRGAILATLAVIVLQSALVVGLWVHRRRLRRTRSELRDELGRRQQAESQVLGLRLRIGRFSRERSLGAMVTAIAHEINQPLIAIQNYAQAARRRVQQGADDPTRLSDLVRKIEGQAQRAGEITQRVRALVGGSEVTPVVVEIAPLLADAVAAMQPDARAAGCRIEFTPAGDLPPVLADPLPVQLVLVNLLRNALESLGPDGSGDRCVTIDVALTDERDVRVRVTDRGPGVPAERAAEIFEPLASSKGDGLGIGLAIARGIVEALGGRLWYEPNPAGGAVFCFTLRSVRP